MIWSSKNKYFHERKESTGIDIARRVQRYMEEYESAKGVKSPLIINKNHRDQEDIPRTKIQFNAAFDNKNFQSAPSLVVWGLRGELLLSKLTLHNNVSSPFAVEAYACFEALKLGISMGIQSINIMGDSRTTIKKCQTTSLANQ